MQEYDVDIEAAGDGKSDCHARAARFKELLRYVFKRFLVFVCFGPGVLGVLWLIGRLIKR